MSVACLIHDCRPESLRFGWWRAYLWTSELRSQWLRTSAGVVGIVNAATKNAGKRCQGNLLYKVLRLRSICYLEHDRNYWSDCYAISSVLFPKSAVRVISRCHHVWRRRFIKYVRLRRVILRVESRHIWRFSEFRVTYYVGRVRCPRSIKSSAWILTTLIIRNLFEIPANELEDR